MQSEKIDLLVTALIKAKGQFKKVEKTKENPFFKSKYADLGTIDEAVMPALHANGITVIQTTEVTGTQAVLATTLAHVPGQWITGWYPLNPVKNDPQGMGSAVTYARRYAMTAMLTVIADDDDDGNAATHTTHKTTTHKTTDGETTTKTFVPAAVSAKHGEKNGKSWTQYGVKDPAGTWYSTFEEEQGALLNAAKAAGEPVTISYRMNGAYCNIVTVEKAAEEVSF